jgi:hypothetical protein
MRSNQSRFTVAFSDLAWESVIGDDVPGFPLAWQVGKYLKAYADKYIPPELLNLGCTVVHTERKKLDGCEKVWTVEWVEEEGDEEEFEKQSVNTKYVQTTTMHSHSLGAV